MKVVKRIADVIFIGILIITIVITVAIYGFKIKPVVVVSGSMEPTVKTGSLCFINYKDKDVGKDDIMAYDAGNLMVIHRVIELKENTYITKGDANEYEDPVAVSSDKIKGKYMFSIPGVGKIVYELNPFIVHIYDIINKLKERKEVK